MKAKEAHTVHLSARAVDVLKAHAGLDPVYVFPSPMLDGKPLSNMACLAHREADKVKAAYNRAQFTEERRALLAAWSEYLARPAARVIALQAV